MSYCDNDIKVMKYVGDSEDIKHDLGMEYFTKYDVDIFDEKSPFFNDKCQKYDLDVDIILLDRREDIYQNVSFCEDNCVYMGMNYTLLTAECSCDANILEYDDEKEENEQDEKLSMNNLVKSFTSELLSFNFDVVKCYHLVFDPILLKKNQGFYTNIAMIGVQIGILTFFFIKKLSPIKVFMINLSNANPPKKSKRLSQKVNLIMNNINNLFKKLNDKQNEIKNNDNIYNNPIKLTTTGENILNDKLQSQKDIHQMNPKIIKNKILSTQNLRYHLIPRSISPSKEKENIISCESINSEISSNKKKESEKNKEAFEKRKLYTPEYEKYNHLDFEDALYFDKRNFFQMFWAFICQQHVIINTFFAEIFLELRAIKISFFIFGLEINFFFNAFFYTDDYISDTYHNNGILNFFSSLPKSVYSFLVTLIISALLKMLSNSKDQLIKIIEKKDNNPNYLKDVEVELKKLNRKLYIYFIIVFILGILFAYYSSAFCAVYKNSQTFWLIGCFESLGMDLLTPFGICFVLAAIRYLCIKKKFKLLYKIYSIIEKIL